VWPQDLFCNDLRVPPSDLWRSLAPVAGNKLEIFYPLLQQTGRYTA
jgi:hypothetical protein